MPNCQGHYKSFHSGREEPVMIRMNYATLIKDEDEEESLCVPFEMMRHGIKTNLTPMTLGETGWIQFYEEYLRFEFNGEKLYWEIKKLSKLDLDTLEFFELNSSYFTITGLGETKKNVAQRHPFDEVEEAIGNGT